MSLLTVLQDNKRLSELDRDPLPRGWTADLDSLIRNHPAKYLEIIEGLQDGVSLKRISDEQGLSLRDIRKIRDRHPAVIESHQEAVKRNIEDGVHLLTEKIIEKADKISPAMLAASLHMLVQDGELLAGRATARIETKKIATPEELDDIFNQLPSAKVIEI